MKKMWVMVLILVILVGAAYVERRTLKSVFMGSPMQVVSPTVTPSTAIAPSDNIYLTKTNSTKGNYLTDFAGVTLYTFDKDTAGVSTCYDACAKNWPVYTSGATAQGMFPANITVITRTGGTKQFAWKGMPLYYYSGDKVVGDTTGDGVGGIWHIVKP